MTSANGMVKGFVKSSGPLNTVGMTVLAQNTETSAVQPTGIEAGGMFLFSLAPGVYNFTVNMTLTVGATMGVRVAAGSEQKVDIEIQGG